METVSTKKGGHDARQDTAAADRRDGHRVGNLTKDPDLRVGKTGTLYTSFGLAVNTPKVAGQWKGQQRTDFYDVVCFGTLAQHAAASLSKGVRVVVCGRSEVEHYTADDGTQRERKRIVAEALGPDLRWATATIHKTPSRPATSEEAAGELEVF